MLVSHWVHAPIITGAVALVILEPLLLNLKQVPLNFSKRLIPAHGYC